jgi:hypothetical protein
MPKIEPNRRAKVRLPKAAETRSLDAPEMRLQAAPESLKASKMIWLCLKKAVDRWKLTVGCLKRTVGCWKRIYSC